MNPIEFAVWTIRGVWGRPSLFKGPAKGAVLHHSVTNLVDPPDPVADAQAVEEVIWRRRIKSFFQMDAYSFKVAQDGTAFVVRGYKYRNGANRRTKLLGPLLFNRNTLSICFIGNYHPNVAGVATLTPTDIQLRAAAKIIRDGIASGDIVADPWIGPHSDLHATACCGDLLRADIDTIRDYVNNPPEETTVQVLPEAQQAADDGIWTRFDAAGVDTAQQPATREHASIMALRARDQAIAEIPSAPTEVIAAIPPAPTAALDAMATQLATQASIIGALSDRLSAVDATLTAALARIDTLETGTGPTDSRSEVLQVQIVGIGTPA